ncbi:hypothetical protein C9374_001814 [Naegleria lovaniensis]|uniref:F5/8 type C domain-containing protein n=1 Tax=Naegleria lovaniensis TaxID=51637 RepID=A0AA88GUZ1_NAELO|nr:uncharacterized protein C9374_001814 [Naegleria lovaniensis]KAG2387482.1 hypothetical protein C9374_001814 [Naegleria lovaniensis]
MYNNKPTLGYPTQPQQQGTYPGSTSTQQGMMNNSFYGTIPQQTMMYNNPSMNNSSYMMMSNNPSTMNNNVMYNNYGTTTTNNNMMMVNNAQPFNTAGSMNNNNFMNNNFNNIPTPNNMMVMGNNPSSTNVGGVTNNITSSSNVGMTTTTTLPPLPVNLKKPRVHIIPSLTPNEKPLSIKTLAELSLPRWIIPYQLKMSSKYSSTGNTIACLSEEGETAGLAGVCTNSEEQPFVQIMFKEKVRVSRMIISPCIASSWGSQYLEGCVVEYETDNGQWNQLATVTFQNGLKTLDLSWSNVISASTFRVRKNGTGYIGIGVWRLFGICQYDEEEPIEEQVSDEIDSARTMDLLCLPYNLKMSSKYSSCDNSTAALWDESNLGTGAGTCSENNAYIEAAFKGPQYFTHIRLKPLVASGWGSSYTSNTLLEFSENGLEWRTCMSLVDITENQPIITLRSPVLASNWRIRREAAGYVGVGLLKFYTFKPYYNPYSQPAQQPNPLKYTLTMSSKYVQCQNTFEILQEETKTGGAGTDKDTDAWIQANLDDIYNIYALKIRPIQLPEWGIKYLQTATVDCSVDGSTWVNVKTLPQVEPAVNVVSISRVPAKYIRISMKHDQGTFVGLGTFKVYGYK